MRICLILHENEPVGGTHFHMNGFTRRLVLTPRQKATRKWSMLRVAHYFSEGVKLSAII